jgi:hypothetical protein
MEVMEQIDLYAAGECDTAEARRIAAHIAACPACAGAADEAGALQGVLTLRFRERESVQALHERLQRETKQRPVILLLLRRTAAVAAMLLVMIGSLALLGLWQPRTQPDDEAQIAILWKSENADIVRSGPNRVEVRSGQAHLEVRGAAAKDDAPAVEIRTPAGIARVKASRFFMDVEANRQMRAGSATGVLVLSGQVSFHNAKGEAIIRPGEVLEASPNAAPRPERVNGAQEKALVAPASARPDWAAIYRALAVPRGPREKGTAPPPPATRQSPLPR